MSEDYRDIPILFTGLAAESREELAFMSAMPTSATDMLEPFMRAEIPDSVDPRKWGLRVENQGSMGSCRGHSLALCLEILHYWETQDVVQLSRLFSYIECQRQSSLFGRDRGSTMVSGIKVATEIGLCPESLIPYPNPVRYTTKYPVSREEAARAASPFKTQKSIRVTNEANPYKTVKQLLGTGWVCEIGSKWPIPLDSNHTVTDYRRAGRGRHATALIGYLEDGRIINANSHGSRYAASGYHYWTESGFNRAASDLNIIAHHDQSKPEPRKRPDYLDVWKSR